MLNLSVFFLLIQSAKGKQKVIVYNGYHLPALYTNVTESYTVSNYKAEYFWENKIPPNSKSVPSKSSLH